MWKQEHIRHAVHSHIHPKSSTGQAELVFMATNTYSEDREKKEKKGEALDHLQLSNIN